MIYELRVYHAVPGRLPDLLKRFDTITLKSGSATRSSRPGFGPSWPASPTRRSTTCCNGTRSPTADEVNAFQADPEWHQARRNREERPDRRAGDQFVPAADQLLGGEVVSPTTSAGRCPPSPSHASRGSLLSRQPPPFPASEEG